MKDYLGYFVAIKRLLARNRRRDREMEALIEILSNLGIETRMALNSSELLSEDHTAKEAEAQQVSRIAIEKAVLLFSAWLQREKQALDILAEQDPDGIRKNASIGPEGPGQMRVRLR